jgi:hypothetical protein
MCNADVLKTLLKILRNVQEDESANHAVTALSAVPKLPQAFHSDVVKLLEHRASSKVRDLDR